MKHAPEKILIVSIPDRKFDSASDGFGVAERDGMGVTEREITPDSLLSFDSGTTIRRQSASDGAIPGAVK